MAELMTDPVLLPTSNTVMDRANVSRAAPPPQTCLLAPLLRRRSLPLSCAAAAQPFSALLLASPGGVAESGAFPHTGGQLSSWARVRRLRLRLRRSRGTCSRTSATPCPARRSRPTCWCRSPSSRRASRRGSGTRGRPSWPPGRSGDPPRPLCAQWAPLCWDGAVPCALMWRRARAPMDLLQARPRRLNVRPPQRQVRDAAFAAPAAHTQRSSSSMSESSPSAASAAAHGGWFWRVAVPVASAITGAAAMALAQAAMDHRRRLLAGDAHSQLGAQDRGRAAAPADPADGAAAGTCSGRSQCTLWQGCRGHLVNQLASCVMHGRRPVNVVVQRDAPGRRRAQQVCGVPGPLPRGRHPAGAAHPQRAVLRPGGPAAHL